MKNPAAFEVLSALRARGVSLWRIATHPEASPQGRQKTGRTDRWRSRDEQFQLLWLLGWEWSQAALPLSVTRTQAIGQQLLRAVDALWQREN